jgi:predicted dehydrogenase
MGVSDLSDLHMTAFVDNRHVADVWLAEPGEEARRALAGRWGIIKRAVGDWRELAAEESVDVAHLCGPPAERVEIARAFLAAGKSVLLDAPPAASLEDLDTMIAAAQGAAGRLYASLPQLLHPAIIRAQKLVKDGEIGEVFLGQVTALDNAEPPRPALSDTGFHAIYVLQRFLGAATAVTGECGRRGDARREARDASGEGKPHPLPPLLAGEGGEESCAVSLRHGEGKLSGILVSQVSAGTRPTVERRMVGTEGMLLIRDDPEDELPLIGFRGEEVIPVPIRQPLHVQPWYVGRMLDHFVDCLLEGKEPEVTVREARAALATALAAREAARTGQRVRIP